MITQDQLIHIFSEYAYHPEIVYSLILALLTASSFGLPLPEELTLISAGAIGYFAQNPELYPPPQPGMTPINPWTLSVVCFFAVFLSDLLIYWLGRSGRSRLQRIEKLKRLFQHRAFVKAESLIQNYGAWMAGVFRFTPGLRFPGHLACGMMGLSLPKFCLIDGTAALLTVPTQVLLVSFYGNEILSLLQQFKLTLIFILLFIIVFLLIKRMRSPRGRSQTTTAC